MWVDRILIGAVVLLAAGILAWQAYEADRRWVSSCALMPVRDRALTKVAEAFNRCAVNRVQIQVQGRAADMRLNSAVWPNDPEGFLARLAIMKPSLVIHRDGDRVTIRLLEEAPLNVDEVRPEHRICRGR